ncbi:hypothetical protein [Egicoccus sp. AB-alg6-2]|uniref:hypothetical protein n=1 Tax=Egicoccus sp. AB-alg6-2 TaxID=3242692 RepID=UPI00359E935B
MTDRSAPGGLVSGGHVRVITLEQAAVEARELLDDFERRYGLPSDRRGEAFTDADGVLQRTGDYLLWSTTWERWHGLTSRLAS